MVDTKAKELKKFILNEMKTCRDDPEYFFSKYCKIRHPAEGIIPFNIFDYQREVLDAFIDPSIDIIFIVKSRQIGITQLVAEYILWLTRFHSAQEAFIISEKMRNAVEVQERVSLSFNKLPSWLKPIPEKFSATHYRLPNKSKCTAVPTTEDIGRSMSLNFLFIDEADMINGVEEVWAAAQPTLSTGGGKIVVASTLKRYGWFWSSYKHFTNLMSSGDKTVKTFLLTHNVRPGFDEEWYEDQVKKMGSRVKAQRELKCDLSESEYMFYNDKDLRVDFNFKKDSEEFKKPLILKNNIKTTNLYGDDKKITLNNKDLWIFQEPEKDVNKIYFITADTAKGGASSKNAAIVWDLISLEQVAEYNGDIDVNDFPWLLKWMGEYYNNAIIAIEDNNTGYQVISALMNYGGYDNVVVRVKASDLQLNDKDIKETLYMTYGKLKDNYGNISYKLGWNTNMSTRALMLDKSQTFLNAVKLYSSRLFNEMREFEIKGSRPQGRITDDLVITFGIFCYLASYFTNIGDLRNYNNIKNKKEDLELVSEINMKIDNDKDTMLNDFACALYNESNKGKNRKAVSRMDDFLITG